MSCLRNLRKNHQIQKRLLRAVAISLSAALFVFAYVPISRPASAETNVESSQDKSLELKVVESKPYPALTNCFKRTDGWTGADGAYSVKVDDHRTLWFFGDTWIGPIKNGKRISTRNSIVNNTAALQMFRGKAPFKFFWKQPAKSLFVPEQSDCYYWPGDGACVDGKLYVFMHVIKNKPDAPPPFQFQRIGDDLIQIDNPSADASSWRWKRIAVSRTVDGANFGISCLTDSKYLYSYCSYPPAKSGLNVHPLIVARIERTALAGLFGSNTSELAESKWEFLCEKKDGTADDFAQKQVHGVWSHGVEKPIILFPDAAPEMSVSRVNGIDAYVATYMPPLDHSIYLRFSKNPEGPFSPRVLACKCPESEKWMLLYSAKAHPELAKAAGEMIITYCRNTSDFSFHLKSPYIYAPQAVRVMITNPALKSWKKLR